MAIVLRADDGRILLLDNEGTINIGRRKDSDLVLADSAVSKLHARVLRRDGRTIVVDLKSAAGTMINGQKITAPTIVREDDVIRIGQTNITCAKHRPGDNDVNISSKIETTDPKEREMLDSLAKNPSDDGLRQVYGDWLMDHGRAGEVIAIERRAERHPE